MKCKRKIKRKSKRKARKLPAAWWVGRVKAKAGVKIDALKPQALEGLKIVYLLYLVHGKVLTVTSTAEGQHSAGSLHGKGLAFDVRTRDIPIDMMLGIIKDAKDLLGASFDVLLESTHAHIEFDPK